MPLYLSVYSSSYTDNGNNEVYKKEGETQKEQDPEGNTDTSIRTTTGCHKSPYKKKEGKRKQDVYPSKVFCIELQMTMKENGRVYKT